MSPFDIIKAARLAIANIGTETGPSENSQKEYQRTAIRIIGDNHLDAAQIVKSMTDTRKASTWFKNKAALQWYARKKIRNLLKAQDAIQRQLRETPDDAELREDWLSMVKVLDAYLTLLDRIPSGMPVPQEKREPRHSKRKDLAGLPTDWREKILMHLEKYVCPTLRLRSPAADQRKSPGASNSTLPMEYLSSPSRVPRSRKKAGNPGARWNGSFPGTAW
jgi:hypothetical protein